MKTRGKRLLLATASLGMALVALPTNVNAAEGTGSASIPADAVEFNGHSYYIFCNEDYTYEQAAQFCTAVGGYLATITSPEENDFLFRYMLQAGYGSAYFGLSDAQVEGNWVWSNGEKVEYTNWSDNEPNGESDVEDYGMFYYKYSTGKWNDGQFGPGTVNGGKAFICEWGETTQPQAAQPAATVPTDAIPVGAGEFNGHHYYVFNNDDYTYDQASAFCTILGGHLATITSQEENDYLFQYMKNSGHRSAYFGLSDAEEEGKWVWCTGENVEFTNWSKREPNAESPNEDYAMFYYLSTPQKWNDGQFGPGTVNGGKSFICEWDY